ncbi:MAG TPA: hypothetical protein DIW47_13095 [Bacteroidetes bacterium]|nr:hypothetical protein [Bacteroidota bacterium]
MTNKFLLSGSIFLLACLGHWSCKKKDIDIDITTQRWQVERIKKPGRTFNDNAKGTYILEFVNDTSFTLSLDVNSCGGNYSIPDKGKISFASIACTEVCCDLEVAEYLPELLKYTTDYYVKDNFLILTSEGQIKLKPL